MKTLRAFWHWVDNDKPASIRRDKLSPVARQALLLAEVQVADRALGSGLMTVDLWLQSSSADGTNPNCRPEFFRPELVAAVRDLSLAICPALEAMRAAVPEAPPAPADGLFRREYLADWIPAKLSQDTFFGVDRGERKDERLSGVRVPRSFSLDGRREPRCTCLACARARDDAQVQAKALGFDLNAVKVATHDGLLPMGYMFLDYAGDGTLTKLEINVDNLRNQYDCDRLRGLAPQEVVVKGNWMSCPFWQYLRDQIICPMVTNQAKFRFA